MVEPQDWTHWHLTPRGWVPGAWARDEAADLSVPPPPDRVLTYEYFEYRSPENRVPVFREVWRGPDFAQLVDLLAQWGEAPRRLYVQRRSRTAHGAHQGRRG
jgi:hypothetical protein